MSAATHQMAGKLEGNRSALDEVIDAREIFSVICSGSDDNTVQLWEASHGKFIASSNNHTSRVLDVAFVPDSTKLISMSMDKLIRWDSPLQRDCMEVVEFTRNRESFFNCMTVSGSGKMLAAATVDNMITVWEVETSQVQCSLPGHCE